MAINLLIHTLSSVVHGASILPNLNIESKLISFPSLIPTLKDIICHRDTIANLFIIKIRKIILSPIILSDIILINKPDNPIAKTIRIIHISLFLK